ncbi:MAG: cytochrome c biogenesis protein ResB [Mangrovibacterium sp.]
MNKAKYSGFKPHILCCLLLNISALLMQFAWGAFPIAQLAFPTHAYLLLLILSLGIIFCFILNKSKIGNFFSSYQAAITSICSLSIWAIVLGLTTQVKPTAHAHDFAGQAGIRHMTDFFPFVLSYCYLIFCLCFATIRRLKRGLSVRNLGFFLNHAGLLFTLYFIGAGAADVKQYSVTVQEGQTEWRGVDEKTGEVTELPIAVRLRDFVMEEYAPKLAVVHRNTGKVLPEELPQYLDIDTLKPEGKLLDWKITIDEFFMNGVRANDSTYQQMQMPGACPAARITAEDMKTGKKQTSWISAGNNMQLYRFLPIGNPKDSIVIAMTQPEPKAFYSDVDVFLRSGESLDNRRIEVNKPLSADHWMIYQSDYDKSLGTMSITSVFDLVFDPWYKYIIASVILLALGCLFLFWRADKHNKNI